MNVMYASDDNYAWLMGISMISLFENNRDSKEINVFLFGDKLSEKNEKTLAGIAERYRRGFMHIDVEKVKIPEYLMSERYPKSTYSRLFAYDLLPADVKKLIYLDCDIIVNGSLEDLFNRDVEGKAFLTVKDCVSKAYKRKIGLKASDTYINTAWIDDGELLYAAFAFAPLETYLSVNRLSVESYEVDVRDFVMSHRAYQINDKVNSYYRALMNVGDINAIKVQFEGAEIGVRVEVEPRALHTKSHAGIFVRTRNTNIVSGKRLTAETVPAGVYNDQILLKVQWKLKDIARPQECMFSDYEE